MKGTEMNTATTVTLITISSLSLIASGTTLITVWVGAKNMQAEIDKSFLLTMAKDDGPSKMADIQRRLNVDVNYASQYRLRLIAAELIEPVRRGYVDFALPYLREYLRSHAASEM